MKSMWTQHFQVPLHCLIPDRRWLLQGYHREAYSSPEGSLTSPDWPILSPAWSQSIPLLLSPPSFLWRRPRPELLPLPVWRPHTPGCYNCPLWLLLPCVGRPLPGWWRRLGLGGWPMAGGWGGGGCVYGAHWLAGDKVECCGREAASPGIKSLHSHSCWDYTAP